MDKEINSKLDEIIRRLEAIESLLAPAYPYQWVYYGGGNLMEPNCVCGTSVRCYKCYPWGTMPGDYLITDFGFDNSGEGSP